MANLFGFREKHTLGRAEERAPASAWVGLEPLEHRLLLSSDGAEVLGGFTQLSAPENVPAEAGNPVTVPISINNATGVTFASINVSFDSSVLSISTPAGVTNGSLWPGTDGWAVTSNLLSDGELRIIIFNGLGQAPTNGPGEIALLEFQVAPGAPDGPTAIDLEPLDPNEGGLNWTASDGSVLVGGGGVCGLLGDMSGDGLFNFVDITPFKQALTVGGDEGLFLDLMPGGCFFAGDASFDGFVNFLDISPYTILLDAIGILASAGVGADSNANTGSSIDLSVDTSVENSAAWLAELTGASRDA